MTTQDKIKMDVNWGIKKMDKRYGTLVICAAILVLCFVGTASATTWSVDGSGGDADFTGIQDAINKASDGDKIIVHSGVYYENVVVGKSVTLKGIGHPVVDANNSGSAITLTADGITLQGFNATNPGCSWSGSDTGIKVNSRNNTITGNNVSNNDKGIALWSCNNNTITGNNASNNIFGIALFDSSNNTITGNNVSNNNWYGIHIYSSSNNTITGNNASNNGWNGIRLDYSSINTITGNNVSNNDKGIFLDRNSSNNIITGNNVSNNSIGGIRLDDSSNNNTITGNVFVNDGLSVYSSYQNTVEDNTVNGKPLVYLEDVSDYKVEDAGQVILVNCRNITVENLDLTNTCVSIALLNTENSKISNNKVCNNNWDGIYLYFSNNNIITGNNVSNNDDGIRLSSSSSNNTITGNNVCNNSGDGIDLWHSSNNNIITGNNVSNNDEGIYLKRSSSNKIVLNNFVNNINNAKSYKSINIWNSTEKITYTYDGTTYKSYLGNYWADYEGTDAEGDGIGDTSYNIDTENDESDNYPLMKPFENYIELVVGNIAVICIV